MPADDAPRPGEEELAEAGRRRGGRGRGGRRAEDGAGRGAPAGGGRSRGRAGRGRPRRTSRRRARRPSADDEPAGLLGRAAPAPVAGSKEKKREHNSLVELVTIVAVALGLALGIQAFLVKPFRIPSESMVPTLEVGQRVLVDRVSYRFSDPDRGDIIVFKPPAGPSRARCGVRAPERPAVPEGDPGALGHELHQAGGGRAGRPPEGASRGRSTSTASARTSRSPTSTPNAPTCNLPTRDHGPQGRVLHDGRQPGRDRRTAASGGRCRRSGSSARRS